MYKAKVINDIGIDPNPYEAKFGCSHLFFRKEKKAKIVYEVAKLAYKKEYLSVQKKLSNILNKVAKNGYAYCEEAILTHSCRVGFNLKDSGQHMVIRFIKVNYIPEYRVYLGPIVCIDDQEENSKEAKVKKTKLKTGCRSKYPSGEQHLNFYNDEYNDGVVKAANKIYRVEEFSSDRKISGFPFYDAQNESEISQKYKSQIEKQFDEDVQLLTDDGFKFQQVITIPVNGKERTALLFSKTGTKTLSFSGDSVFLDGFELWYKPFVRGSVRRFLEKCFPLIFLPFFENKDERYNFKINTAIEETERLEDVYTKAFNEQPFENGLANMVQVPVIIISKTQVPHFGDDVEHLFLTRHFFRGVISSEYFRKITKQMISKAATVKKAANNDILGQDYGGNYHEDKNSELKDHINAHGTKELKKEYRRNMRKLARPHVDIFTTSIAAGIVENSADNRLKSQTDFKTYSSNDGYFDKETPTVPLTTQPTNYGKEHPSTNTPSSQSANCGIKDSSTEIKPFKVIEFAQSSNNDKEVPSATTLRSQTASYDKESPATATLKDQQAKSKKPIKKYLIIGIAAIAVIAGLCAIFTNTDNKSEIEKTADNLNIEPNSDVDELVAKMDNLQRQVEELQARGEKQEDNLNKETGNDGLYLENVDLGLPSGTLWCTKNESGFYTYEEAVEAWPYDLPTKEQFEELIKYCTWSWTGNGYKIVGSNGNSMFLPAEGWRDTKGKVSLVGTDGGYWSISSDGSDKAWYLNFNFNTTRTTSYSRKSGLSVRRVYLAG